MFSFLAALVGSLLFAALAPSLATAKFAKISFSTVQQCGNFTVSFAGGQSPGALHLSVLPVNGTPVFIPLPPSAWNASSETGVAITFLPFPSGTQFVASLDDRTNKSTALISDILVIKPSDTNDQSCLPPANSFTPRYSIDGGLSQCKNFNVSFDPTVARPPTVRAFVPRAASHFLNNTAVDAVAGVSTFVGSIHRGLTAMLLLEDDDGYAETASLVPVTGDVSSDASCIPDDLLSNVATVQTATTSTQKVTPKIAVIVIAVSSGVVGLLALLMLGWFCRRRSQARRTGRFDKLADIPATPDVEKRSTLPMQSEPEMSLRPTEPLSPLDPTAQYVLDPPYIRMSGALVTPTTPDPRDPFGEQAAGPILGAFSARESIQTQTRLGATAMGNTASVGSALTFNRTRKSTPNPYESTAYAVAERESAYDPNTEKIPGTSPYWGRLAPTPDNSLSSGSALRRGQSVKSISASSVSTVEIDHILEMATVYGYGGGAGDEIPDLPRPPAIAPATLRSSAYMAGYESRQSIAGSGRFSPAGSASGSGTASHSRNGSNQSQLSAGSTRPLNLSQTRLRAFREPPLATLPSSPLPSPGARPSFDAGAVPASRQSFGLPAGPTMPRRALRRSGNGESPRGSGASWDDGLSGFTILSPPEPPTSQG
ncbi:uncharacterized protein BXZ73DRAFT_103267 [Epithele typhae]|uniref:uncharacterized protein n=1 Tax=Epithele typhae TaxID=378194 RepID=UPI002008E396|nr:uncharacterized protein BXZ73DRAFT_103267 [Epithele typhae]KAH9925384.1 hypothetical protein BXZ73DRAFT_103267 [Epithele typhae]